MATKKKTSTPKTDIQKPPSSKTAPKVEAPVEAVRPEETLTPAAPDTETAGTKPAVTPDAAKPGSETAATAEAELSKEVVDTYEKVYRIQAEEPGKIKLPAGFPEDTYGAAAVREAIAHGWRPRTVGELAAKSSVKAVEGDPNSIDILFTVEVVPASEVGVQPPVGETFEEAADEGATTEGDTSK